MYADLSSFKYIVECTSTQTGHKKPSYANVRITYIHVHNIYIIICKHITRAKPSMN